MSNIAERNVMETEEEANDFDMDEDDEFHSPYEIVDMVDEPPFEPDPTDPSQGHIQSSQGPLEAPSDPPPAEFVFLCVFHRW